MVEFGFTICQSSGGFEKTLDLIAAGIGEELAALAADPVIEALERARA